MSENNPGRLRLWADNIEKNSKYGILPKGATNPTILRELAAAWEADRAELASKTMALEDAEESIDRLQATKESLIAEIKGFYAARPTLAEWAELTQARSKAEAALERARALEKQFSEWADTEKNPYAASAYDQAARLLAAALSEGGRP